MMSQPDFWENPTEAKNISRKLSQLNEELEHIGTLDRLKGELETYLQLLEEDFSPALF